MARAFSTSFSYKNKTYAAVITQTDGCINIYIPDETLHEIIPNGRAVVNHETGLKINNPGLSPAQDLILAVMSSIEGHKEVVLETQKEVKA